MRDVPKRSSSSKLAAAYHRATLLRLFLATGVFAAFTLFGAYRYDGPEPLGADAPAERPAAGRMKQMLAEFLGDPPQVHSTGTPQGEAALERLESIVKRFDRAEAAIKSGRMRVRRIDLPWSEETRAIRKKNFPVPPDPTLKNLLVSLEGTEPEWDAGPILVVTHHDSCIWGPGAGDAGSAVVALLEHLRIKLLDPPRRTTVYLFTDGEEYGLLGANAIAAMPDLPFERPVFVLNFDARGTRGGVPMFETHAGNSAWLEILADDLADPKITSSLAVTVYRSLPRATDFNVWSGQLEWPGFNFATIGGAEHYHQASDVPENLSDRTLQHMANHLTRVHAAIDRLETPPGPAGEFARDAVFFDVLGYRVIHYSSMLQEYIAVFIVLAGGTVLYRELDWQITILLRHARAVGISLIAAMGVGVLALAVLRSSPWAQLRFTPYDYPAGMLTVAAAFLVSTFLMEHYSRRHVDDLSDLRCDWPWWVASVLGMWLSLQLPGGAYLLVIPSFVYFFVRIASGNAFWASWAGWIVLALLAGPTLTLLVQALGPWKQPVYAILAALLANLAMTAWIRPRRLIRPTVL